MPNALIPDNGSVFLPLNSINQLQHTKRPDRYPFLPNYFTLSFSFSFPVSVFSVIPNQFNLMYFTVLSLQT